MHTLGIYNYLWLLEKDQSDVNSKTLPEASDWIPKDFWENKTAKNFELSSLGDAEQQLKGLFFFCYIFQSRNIYVNI